MWMDKYNYANSILQKILDGRTAPEPEGETVMESLAAQAEANDEDRLAQEQRNREAAREVNVKFRDVHLTSPYAHCKIIEADPANG